MHRSDPGPKPTLEHIRLTRIELGADLQCDIGDDHLLQHLSHEGFNVDWCTCCADKGRFSDTEGSFA